MSKIHFLVLTIVLVCFRVEARSPMLTHDRFVYLTDSEQEQFIIKTMEFVVDLEDRYQYEVTTYGYSEERHRRYTSLMKKAMSLFIDSAHAESLTPKTLEETTQLHLEKAKQALSRPAIPLVIKQGKQVKNPIPATLARTKKSWEAMADDFYTQINTASKGPISGKCIYAGWVSEMRGNPSLCVHPNFISPKSPSASPENMTYGQEQGCNGKNQITCNPVIFGYKSEGDKSLFCVQAGIPESQNSALSCMKAALSDSSDTKTDTKEVRLKNLRQRLVAKPDAFANVQKFIYQYCVCENAPGTTDKSYHDRIRPHRTCFGMIEMVAETSICEEPKIDIDTTIFKNLRDAATSEKINKSSGGSAVDAFYKRFLVDVKKSSPNEYKALCPNDKMPEIAKPKEEKTLPEVVVTAAVPKYACKEALCASKAAEKPKDAKTSEEKAPAAPEEFGCMVNLVDEANGETVTPDATIDSVPKSREEKELKVSASFGGKTFDLSCPITFEEVQKPTTNPTIKVALKDKTITTQKRTAETTEADGLKIVWTRRGFKSETKEEAKPKDSGIKLAGEEEEKKPEEKIPEETKPSGDEVIGEDKPDITVPRITTDYEVCAKLVGGSSEPQDCKTVPKADPQKELPAAPVNRGMASPMQQQMPGRMGNDTSAMGIR